MQAVNILKWELVSGLSSMPILSSRYPGCCGFLNGDFVADLPGTKIAICVTVKDLFPISI